MRKRLERIEWTCDRCGTKEITEGLAIGYELPFGWTFSGDGGIRDYCAKCSGKKVVAVDQNNAPLGIKGKRSF